MCNGRLWIVSGPSGSGKDTLLAGVLRQRPELRFSISCVTRAMRDPSEAQKYRFLSRETFEEMLAHDEFLEHNVYLGNYYGTPRGPVEECLQAGRDMIVEIDVNGAAQIRLKRPDARSIFILPPSFEVLRERLAGRGTESPAVVEQRLKSAVEEIARAHEYDYLVINGDLSRATADLLAVLDGERCRTPYHADLIRTFITRKEREALC